MYESVCDKCGAQIPNLNDICGEIKSLKEYSIKERIKLNYPKGFPYR